MPFAETAVQQAERHVREAEERVARQRGLVEELARDGHRTLLALTILLELDKALKLSRALLARLRAPDPARPPESGEVR